MYFKIRINNRSYLTEIVDTKAGALAIKFIPSNKTAWVSLEDWNRYAKQQHKFEEEQNG